MIYFTFSFISQNAAFCDHMAMESCIYTLIQMYVVNYVYKVLRAYLSRPISIILWKAALFRQPYHSSKMFWKVCTQNVPVFQSCHQDMMVFIDNECILFIFIYRKENKELIYFYNQTARTTAVFICSSQGRQGAS